MRVGELEVETSRNMNVVIELRIWRSDMIKFLHGGRTGERDVTVASRCTTGWKRF